MIAKPSRACAMETAKADFPCHGCRGYLLMEALIAIAIFSIGFLATGSLIFSTSRNNRTGDTVTQATMLAEQKIEELKQRRLAELVVGESADNESGIFTRTCSVEDPFGTDTSRRIRVTVSWNHTGWNRSIQFTTITLGNGL